jgi:hypothetical protein
MAKKKRPDPNVAGIEYPDITTYLEVYDDDARVVIARVCATENCPGKIFMQLYSHAVKERCPVCKRQYNIIVNHMGNLDQTDPIQVDNTLTVSTAEEMGVMLGELEYGNTIYCYATKKLYSVTKGNKLEVLEVPFDILLDLKARHEDMIAAKQVEEDELKEQEDANEADEEETYDPD